MVTSGFTLRSKLVAMSISTIAALIVLFGVLLFNGREQLLSDRKEKVRNLVEAAHSQIAFYEARARSGEMPLEAAQKMAMDSLRNARYEEKEYFWINDFQPKMLMHPFKPELEGQDLSNNKDSNGKQLFVEFVKEVKTNGAGFVDYQWSKPGLAAPQPKLSYVKGFAPWGWVIGTGIYIDDVDTKFQSDAVKLLLWGIGIGGFIAISLLLVSRNIIYTLGGDPTVASAVTRRIANGDLATPVHCAAGNSNSLLANIGNMQESSAIQANINKC